jgi:cold-inducible RNA-binding protein
LIFSSGLSELYAGFAWRLFPPRLQPIQKRNDRLICGAPCPCSGEKQVKNLFVGNMSFQMTESDLRALFEPFGQVTRVHIATDRETGRARGFAFVEMPNDAEAAKAIAGLDGKEASGRNLKVNEARPKGESGPSRAPRSSGVPRGGRGPGGGSERDGNRGRFSHEDYRESARQPREPRW